MTTAFGDLVLDAWRRAVDGWAGQRTPVQQTDINARYLRARTEALAGNFTIAERRFADLVATAPGFAPALEAHGEALEMLGESERAAARYDIARKSRSRTRRGAPDRCYVLRNRGAFVEEIAAYTAVLKSGADKRRPLTYVARGNAYLAMGHAKLALLDYRLALELNPKLREIDALIGEAWAMLGNYPRALSAFDRALSARPDDRDSYGGRAIVQAALGNLAAADADWRRQLELLPADQASARACVLLRLADYAAALPELERALKKEPADPYWRLYRLTALRRLAAVASPCVDAADSAWPGPLLALHAGHLSSDEVLRRAYTAARHAEALFQVAVFVAPRDRGCARSLWAEVVDKSAPSLIENAAARHELARCDMAGT